jgi:hypothetical protein
VKRTCSFAVGTSLSLSLLLSAGQAAAQPVDAATKAAARQLGEEGMALSDKGECAPAAEKLTRAHELVHVPTLALYAGKCLEKLGRLVEASERYFDATRDVVEAGAAPAQRTAQADAERARKALLPRLASVEIAPQPPVPDAVVTLDGKVLPVAMFGVKRPIDPGSHAVEVQRAGGRAARSFTLKEGESTRIEIPVPAGYAYPQQYPPGVVPYAYPPPYARPLPAAPEVEMRRRSLGLFISGIVLIPLGSIAILGGAVDALSNTGAAGRGGDALVIGGFVGLAAGITMTVIGGKKVPVEPATPPAVSFEPLLGPTGGGLRMRF